MSEKSPIYFVLTELDRCANMRDQKHRLQQLKKFKTCHFVPVYRGNHIYVSGEEKFYVSSEDIKTERPHSFLGILNEELWFSCGLNDQEARELEKKLDARFTSIRQYAMALAEDGAHIALYSRGLDLWQIKRNFCPECGTRNSLESSGHKMVCQNGHEQFPHIEPAIIVLVSKGDQCLLGRKHSWPPNVYSTLAGFVEAGESIEDAVYREIYEESNIRIKNVEYFGSQPWPFPSSLMLAFNAEGVTDDIRLDDEMEDVRWFKRDDLIKWVKEGSIILSPRFTVANNLISNFLGQNY
ncbi:MAG: NAD(+) diphosphatase [Proteobacteria bacterium]|nr:NAD(+) diphosphatase [Pseudomonadota bacterium]